MVHPIDGAPPWGVGAAGRARSAQAVLSGRGRWNVDNPFRAKIAPHSWDRTVATPLVGRGSSLVGQMSLGMLTRNTMPTISTTPAKLIWLTWNPTLVNFVAIAPKNSTTANRTPRMV